MADSRRTPIVELARIETKFISQTIKELADLFVVSMSENMGNKKISEFCMIFFTRINEHAQALLLDANIHNFDTFKINLFNELDLSDYYKKISDTDKWILNQILVFFKTLFAIKQSIDTFISAESKSSPVMQNIANSQIRLTRHLDEIHSFASTLNQCTEKVNREDDLKAFLDRKIRDFNEFYCEHLFNQLLKMNNDQSISSETVLREIDSQIEKINNFAIPNMEDVYADVTKAKSELDRKINDFNREENNHAKLLVLLQDELKRQIVAPLLHLQTDINLHQRQLCQLSSPDIFVMCSTETKKGWFGSKIEEQKATTYINQATLQGIMQPFIKRFGEFLEAVNNRTVSGEHEARCSQAQQDFVWQQGERVRKIAAVQRAEKVNVEAFEAKMTDQATPLIINANERLSRRKEIHIERLQTLRQECVAKMVAKEQAQQRQSLPVVPAVGELPLSISLPNRRLKQKGFLRRHWSSLAAATTIGGLAGAGIGFTLGWFFAPVTFGLSVPALAGIGAAAGALVGGAVGLVGSTVAWVIWDKCVRSKQTASVVQTVSDSPLRQAPSLPPASLRSNEGPIGAKAGSSPRLFQAADSSPVSTVAPRPSTFGLNS